MNDVSIAVLHPDDIEAAVALWHATGLTRPWNDPHADIRLALDGASSTVLAGRRDDRLIATAMVGADGHRAWIYYLAVAPSHQGQGLGRRMLAACEEWARGRDMPKLHLLVRAENGKVMRFYETLGYERSDTVLMTRWLNQR